MFEHLTTILSQNPIFQSRGRKPQRPIKYQLGAFLIRYGTLGSDTRRTALQLSIGHGTVFLYCRRVTRAIRELRDQYIGFPSEQDQQHTIDTIHNAIGFPRCVGSGDGSLIRFDEKPLVDGTQFMGRKQFFGATVDHRTRITSYEIGWPAAVTDSRIFKQSDFWKHRVEYLRDGHYILVDKGVS
ncbi:hypothetical protein K435DRAFT_818410 [Dendrothele bispora CBS 962.96]|uniref:DDE Tnp4 domain-containing protein n=1 Tax=Dendrothele bispora (strain CBS 962.96) TaxID=1314807 RepID=A0A4S8MC24_DENBC|nr:hypothetical protein K435DRAFT_818410 [Dendrothele bispora CBS 962.96]